MQPKVSVVTVTYNHERYIESAVRSVLEQNTTFPIEYLVSDDCSTDGASEILKALEKEYPGRMIMLLREKNFKGALNFSDTYAKCAGEYVAFLEGDDYWTNSYKLQCQVDWMDAHPDCPLCFHPTSYVDEIGRPIRKQYPEEPKRFYTLDDMMVQNWAQIGSVMLRRELMPEIPPWFSELLLGDWPLFILMARFGDLCCLPETMLAYRIHPNSHWSSRLEAEKTLATIEMFRILAEHTSEPLRHKCNDAQVRTIQSLVDSVDVFRKSMSYRLGHRLLAPFRSFADFRDEKFYRSLATNFLLCTIQIF